MPSKTFGVVGQNNTRSARSAWSSTPRSGRPERPYHIVGGFGKNKKSYRSFLDFDWNDQGIGYLTKAELIFYVYTGDGLGADPQTRVSRLTNHFPARTGNTWAQNQSANPGKASGGERHSRFGKAEGTEVRFDVTGIVGQWLPKSKNWRDGSGQPRPGGGAGAHGFALWNNGTRGVQFSYHSNTSPQVGWRPRLEVTYDYPNYAPDLLNTISPSGSATHGEPFVGEFSDPNRDHPARIRLQVRKQGGNVVWDHSYGYRPEWPEQDGIWTWSLWNPGESVLRGNIPYEWRVRGFDSGGKMADWTGWRAFTPTGPPPTLSMRPVGTHPTLQGYTFVADWATEPGQHIDSYRVQVKHSDDVWSQNIWDETFTYLTSEEQGGGYLAFTYGGPNLAAGDYHVRVQVVDSRGVSSEWSADAAFTLTIGSEDDNQSDGDGFPPYSTGYKRKHSPARIILYDVDGPNRGPGTVKAIIEDAHNIGMSSVVNEPGEFFFTLVSTHPQAGECEPFQRHWALEQYRRGNWRRIGEGLLTDFDAGEDDIIVYGTDYLGLLARSVDSRFPGPGKLDATHAEGGAKYRDERVSDIIADQLTEAKTATDSQVGFIELGTIQSMGTRVHIFSSFKQRLDFIRGLIESHRAGTGWRTRLKARYDKSQSRYEWDLRGAPGIDRDDLRMWYGSTLQNFRVIGMGTEYATRVHGIGTEPNTVRPHYFAYPPDNTSDFLTQTFGTMQNVEIWNDVVDANDLARRVQQLQAERSKVGKRLRLAIRVHSIDPFDGYDLTDNIPIDIDRGLVETSRYGSGYWTLWGLEYRVFPDGHDELTWAVKPREDDVPPNDDLIPSNPFHRTHEWYLGAGPPPDCATLIRTAETSTAPDPNTPNPCDCDFYLDTDAGIIYERVGPDYTTWQQMVEMPAIPPPPGGWYPGDQGPPAKVTGVALVPQEVQQPDGTVTPAFQVLWTGGSETDLQGYEVQLTPQGNPTTWANPVIRKVGKDVTTITIENVRANTLYDVRVRAYDMEGYYSEWSDVVSETSLGDSIPPGVLDPPDINPGYMLLAVRWKAAQDPIQDIPANDIAYYQLRIARQSDPGLYLQRVDVDSTILIVNDLDYNETYDVQVRAVDTSGNVNDGNDVAVSVLDEASNDLGWSEVASGQPLDVGSADAGFDSVVANIVQATEISADQITTGDLTVGKPNSAGTIRIYDEDLRPTGAWGTFGLISADPDNPTRAIWRTPDGSMKFTDTYQWDGVSDIETGLPGTVWTTAIDHSGINAEAITFGAAGGGNNRLLNAGFELQAFIGVDQPVSKVWTESADWATATGQVNLRTDGPDLRMTKEP